MTHHKTSDIRRAAASLHAAPFPTAFRLVSFMSILAAAAALWVIGSHPVAEGLTRAPWDKLAHFGAFGLISAACGVASGARGWRLLAWCLVCVAMIGGMDEWHQASLPGRTASWTDLAADIAGGFAGAGLVALMQKWQLRRSTASAINATTSASPRSNRSKAN